MEINDTTMALTWFYKLYGFAPYKIVRNKVNQIIDFKLNRSLCVYSLMKMIAFTLASNYALLYDFYSGHALRMKTLTSCIVFWLDVNIVSISSSINTIMAIISLKNTHRVNQLFNRIDKDLSVFDGNDILHTKSVRRRIYGFVGIAFMLLIMIISTDFYAWYLMALRNDNSSGVQAQNSVTNLLILIPLYLLYTAFVPLHAKSAVTIYRIGLRYRSLNNIISVYADAVNRYGYFRSDYKQAQDVVYRFIKIYDSLGMVLKCVCDESGIIIIFLLVSCLFYLVISVYVFIEYFCEHETWFAILQFAWICFHFARFISIVEPCHMIFIEAQKTTKCVCKLMQTKHDLFALNHFWNKLWSNQVHVTVCGICRIDRRMLTSISAAITTYVVILLQFRGNDGHGHDFTQHDEI